jgi:putative endonuclease
MAVLPPDVSDSKRCVRTCPHDSLGLRSAFVTPHAWFVYILRCGDGSLYTGVARDVAARIAKHEAGNGARYTRGRGPLQLCAKRRCESKSDALRLELAIKRLPRASKERLAVTRRLGVFARRFFSEPREV